MARREDWSPRNWQVVESLERLGWQNVGAHSQADDVALSARETLPEEYAHCNGKLVRVLPLPNVIDADQVWAEREADG